MSKRYAPVISGNTGGKGPGREKTPAVQIQTAKKDDFAEGLYVAVSKPEDLYILQSSRPQKVILNFSQKNIKHLLADNKTTSKKTILPFKPAEIILSLDPWFPQEIANYETGIVAGNIEKLVEKGYTQYIVNNPGHLSLFRNFVSGGTGGKVRLIAGPWLYTFNSWALSFVSSLGVDAFISPLENNRQNLERTLGVKSRNNSDEKTRGGKKQAHSRRNFQHTHNALLSKYFITVFAWPPLFNIKANLEPVLKLDSFADNRNEGFLLLTGDEGSRVYPRESFSIIDKIPFLKEAGFARFIVDLTGPALKKSDYRDLMNAVKEGSPLPNASRFNWKDGFFTP
jgi:putative protease